MKKGLRKLFLIITFVLILIVALFPGCKSPGGASLPIQVRLSFSEPPVLGKPVQLIATFNLSPHHLPEVAKGVTAKFKLSEGFQFVEGDTEWQGDLNVGQTNTMTCIIKSVKPGNWTAGAEVTYSPGKGTFEAGSKTLYISVNSDGASVSDEPPLETNHPVLTDAPRLSPSTPGRSSAPATTERPGPFVNVSISPIPGLGETVDLVVNVTRISDNRSASLINSRAWVDIYRTNLKGSYLEAKYAVLVPMEEVLVSGETSWQGDARGKYEIRLTSKIRLPTEGLWKIKGCFSGENWTTPETSFTKIVIQDGISAKYDQNDPKFKSGSLGYLTLFNYGDIGQIHLMETLSEVVIEADISKAPRVGEEAIVTVKIVSLHDVPDFSVGIDFIVHGKGGIPLSRVVTGGEPKWAGDLKANQESQCSIKVKCPESGDWEILVMGNSRENENNQRGGWGDTIRITISPTLSYFGFVERPSIVTKIPTNTTAATIPPFR